jgi:hypothetical protein
LSAVAAQPNQRELFQLLEEFFERAVGISPEKFASIGTFGDQIRANATKLAPRGYSAFKWADQTLREYYARSGTGAFVASREIGGLKLVLGGSTRFGQTQFDSVRKMVLYSDTILIPDTVLPWLETPRAEEKFRHVRMLEEVHALLSLKPLVDADLQFPPVYVFPSWEKSLEERDEQTKEQIGKLVQAFLSYFTGSDLESMADVADYVAKYGDNFLRAVERNSLFVAPEGIVGMPLQEAISRYREYIRTWRSEEFVKSINNADEASLVLNGIMERLVPQYHLIENANALAAQPMMCLQTHWHYFSLCAQVSEGRLLEDSLLDPTTVATIRAMNAPKLDWLGNIPVKDLVHLREENENESFRQKLNEYTKELNAASLRDVNRVASEVARALSSLLQEQQKKTTEIVERYDSRHIGTALGLGLTLAATFVPYLAPLVGLSAPLLGAVKYATDKISETRELARAGRSLVGVLATAKSAKDA